MRIGRWMAVAALALLPACGGDRGVDGDASVIADTMATAGPLRLLLDVPQRVPLGHPMLVAGTLTNEGSEPVSVGVGESLALDVVVTRPDGAEVWRRSRHGALPAGAQRTLRPGEVLATGLAWDQRDDEGQRVPPGTYYVRGYLDAAPHSLQTALRRVVIE
jgi:hypothetical protein